MVFLLPFVNYFCFLFYSFLAGFVLYKNPKALLNRILSALIVCFSFWSLGNIFVHSPQATRDIAHLFNNITSSFVFCGFMPLTLYFILAFTERKRLLQSKPLFLAIITVSLFLLFAQWRGDVTSISIKRPYGWTYKWSSEAVASLIYAYFLAIELVSLYLLLNFRKITQNIVKKKQALIIFFCTLFADLISFSTDALQQKLNPHALLDVSNIISLIWIGGIVYAMAKYKFLTITLASAADNIISSIQEMVILLNQDKEITFINKATLNLLGYQRHELEGKPIDMLFPVRHRANQMEKLLREESVKNYAFIFKTKNEVKIPTIFSSSLVRTESGEAAGSVCIVRDFGEQKNIDEIIKLSEAFYSEIFNATSDAIFVHDAETGSIVDVNDKASDMFGYTKEEAKKLKIEDLGTGVPYTQEYALQKIRQAVMGRGQPELVEWKAKAKQGRQFWAEVSLKLAIIAGKERILAVVRDINKRKETEHALRESEQKMKQLLENSPDFILIIDREGKILYINRVLPGYTLTTTIGSSCYYYIMPEFHKDYKKAVAEVFRNKRPRELDCILKISQNRSIWVRNRFVPMISENTVSALMLISTDITKHKNADSILRESEEKYKRMVENIYDVVFQLSPLGIIQYVSPRILEIYGYKPEQLIGQHLKKTTPVHEVSKAVKVLKRVLSGEIVENFEIDQLDSRGNIVHTEVNIIPIKKANKVIAAQGIMRDITARRHAEERLKELYKTNLDIIENSPFGIYVVNEEGNIDYVNPKMLEISGDTAEQFKTINAFTFPTYKSLGLCAKIKAGLKGKFFRINSVEYTAHYGKKTTTRNFVGIPLIEREKRKVLMVVEDITARKKAEKKLQQAYNMLKETQSQLIQAEKMQVVGRLASGVAHEVKNPLGIISQGVDCLEREIGSDKEEPLKVLYMIKEAVVRADKIIRDLLDFSRPSPLELKPCDVNKVIQTALTLAKEQLTIRNVNIKLNLASELSLAMMDENQMKQVFINIFLNSLQAMPEGGRLSVRTSVREMKELGYSVSVKSTDKFRIGEKALICEIEDTGAGISGYTLNKIFDPFFTTKGPGEGTGLGLTIVKTIIENHKGQIKIESKENQGTKVTITLPILKERPEG